MSILSLFPFIVLLLTISRSVFHSRAMEEVVGDMMKNFLPVGQDFVMRNMQLLAHPHKGTQIFSLVMLLVTSTGVFLPLEVALNNVWGVAAEPQLPAQPGSVARAGVRRRCAGDGVGRIDRGPADDAHVGLLRTHAEPRLQLCLRVAF